MKKIVVIDGQGGRLGQTIIDTLVKANLEIELLAIGTNSIATQSMLKAGAKNGATGENPVVVAARDADVIVGPIGIVSADSLYGEVTPKMALAIGASNALKLLLPVSHCNNQVIGVKQISISEMATEVLDRIKAIV